MTNPCRVGSGASTHFAASDVTPGVETKLPRSSEGPELAAPQIDTNRVPTQETSNEVRPWLSTNRAQPGPQEGH
jgi:hypothetical protein